MNIPVDITPSDKQSNVLSISYELALNDLVAFEKYRLRRYRYNKRGFALVLASAAILTFISPGSVTTFNESGETTVELPPSWPVFLTNLVVILAIAFIIRFFLIERQRTSLHGEQWWRGRREVVLAQVGLITINKHQRTELQKSSLERFEVVKNHLFIFLNDRSTLVIPKRAFNSQKELDAFTETLGKMTNAK